MSRKINFRQVAILPPSLWEVGHLDFRDWIQQAFQDGADALYLRIDPACAELPAAWLEELKHFPGQLIFPARLARLYPQAHALHFKASDPGLPIPGRTCGRACHSLQDILSAMEVGFDYVFLSPVFSTRTHAEAPPIGLEALARACAISSIPVFALGGVHPGNKADCIAQGAFGIAAIGMFSR